MARARATERARHTVEAISEDPITHLASVAALIASVNSTDLAHCAASLAGELLPPGSEVVVVLSDSEGGGAVTGRTGASGELEQWASNCLRSGSNLGSGAHPYLAQPILAGEGGALHGIIAVQRPGGGASQAAEVLEAVAKLTGIRAAQIDGAKRARASIEGTRVALGKGLHDLRTPLNSLRLGLHLLEPAMVGRDPALMQRAQRAVDRMAALVSEMFETLNREAAAESESAPISREATGMSAAR